MKSISTSWRTVAWWSQDYGRTDSPEVEAEVSQLQLCATLRSPTPDPFHEQSSSRSSGQYRAAHSKAASVSRQCERLRVRSCGLLQRRPMTPASRRRVQCARSRWSNSPPLALATRPRPRSATREPRRLSDELPANGLVELQHE